MVFIIVLLLQSLCYMWDLYALITVFRQVVVCCACILWIAIVFLSYYYYTIIDPFSFRSTRNSVTHCGESWKGLMLVRFATFFVKLPKRNPILLLVTLMVLLEVPMRVLYQGNLLNIVLFLLYSNRLPILLVGCKKNLSPFPFTQVAVTATK